MKRRYLSIAICIFSLLCWSCKDLVLEKDAILLTGTENSPAVNLQFDGTASMGITVSSTKKMDQTTKVSLKVDEAALQEYNKKTGRNYQLLPADKYTLSKMEVTLQNGESVSEPSLLTINNLDNLNEAAKYCIPIAISSTDGDLPVLEASRKMFVVIGKTIITRAVALRRDIYFHVPSFMTTESLKALKSASMECRVKLNNFNGSDGISTLMGIEETFLLRFGDLGVDSNQLQMAPLLIGSKKANIGSNARFEVDKWYHIAIVWNGSTATLYVNGVADKSVETPTGTLDLTNDYYGGFWIGLSRADRMLDGAISEARVWTKALSQAEIQDNMCAVDPTSPDLLAYWKFNTAQTNGSTILDLTGKNHNVIARGSTPVTFVEGVKCP